MLSLLLLLTLPSLVQADQGDYTYTLDSHNHATITGYTGSGGNVNIPDHIYGHKVIAIGDWAFNFCYSLTSVSVPDTVTNIGSGVFYYCTSLTNVSLPDSITSIADYLLAECYSLTNFTIPNSIINIGNSVFSDDSGLTSIIFPNSITNIGNESFSGCSSLTSLTIPASVTSIGGSVFSFCPDLTGICFLGDAPTIGESIFERDDDLIVYYLPETLGWGETLSDRPTMLWNAQLRTDDGFFGIRTNRFGFNITGASALVVVVEACTDITNPVWSRLRTNSLASGPVYFGDATWMNYPKRFYRIHWP
jgi:hypothetical protein